MSWRPFRSAPGGALLLALALPCCVGTNAGYVPPADSTDGSTGASTGADVTGADVTDTVDETTGADAGTGTSAAQTDTSSPGSASSSSTGEPAMCFELDDFLVTGDPHIMFVIDKSGSMVLETWDHDDDPNTPQVTRWKTLHKAVDAVLTEIQGLAKTGLMMFPSADATNELDQGCLMNDGPEVPLALGNHDVIMGSLPAAESNALVIQGGTPAATGIALASAHLLDQPWMGQLRFIVYVTDGAANCSMSCDPMDGDPAYNECLYNEYDEDVELVVSETLDAGIVTMVIGVDISMDDEDLNGVSPWQKLEDVADAGGVPFENGPKFLPANNEMKLAEAFDFITQVLTPCHLAPSLNFPELPDLPGVLEVKLDGQSLPELTPDSCIGENDEAGWSWIDEDSGSLVICGAACEDYQDGAALDVSFCLE